MWSTQPFSLVLAITTLAMGGCVVEAPELPQACDDVETAPGDLLLETTGTELGDEYRWSEAQRNVSLTPVQGSEYPENVRRDPGRPILHADIPKGDCLHFSQPAPGWYEVDTRGTAPHGTQGCGWYDADPKHIELHGDRINTFHVHSSLACP